jgi:hypothetical protein
MGNGEKCVRKSSWLNSISPSRLKLTYWGDMVILCISVAGFGALAPDSVMAKKSEKKSDSKATFEVRIEGDGVEPSRVPLRSVSEVLSAIQDLASGRDAFELPRVPDEKSIGLVEIRRGSAVYLCVAREPREAIKNLARVGKLLAAKTESAIERIGSDLIAGVLRPLEHLSDVARAVGGRVRVTVAGSSESLLDIASDDFRRFSESVLSEGPTTIVGRVERVGGATDMRCALRVEGRRKLLYCDIENQPVARRLGQQLYQRIAAEGNATWIRPTWRVLRFRIHEFSQPGIGEVNQFIHKLRAAGFDAWDDIEDPDVFIRDLR